MSGEHFKKLPDHVAIRINQETSQIKLYFLFLGYYLWYGTTNELAKFQLESLDQRTKTYKLQRSYQNAIEHNRMKEAESIQKQLVEYRRKRFPHVKRFF